MKFLLVFACLAATALAQTIDIAAPADLSTVYRGKNFTVEVDKPVRSSQFLRQASLTLIFTLTADDLDWV